jgi:hypothetical protein
MKNNKLFERVLWIVIGVLIVGSAFTAYYRAVIVHDYDVYLEIDCNPDVESCFTYYCDPQWEECAGIPEEDTWYYKILQKDGRVMSANCDPNEKECPEFTCEEGDEHCEIIYCNENVDGECNLPPKAS